MKFIDKIKVNPTISFTKGKVYPFIEMANVDFNARSPKKINSKNYSSGVKFEKGDTVIARIEPCLQNGKGFYVNELPCGFGSTEFLIFRPKDESIDGKFLYYYLQTDYIRKSMIASMTGATGRQRVNNDIFESLEIEMPIFSIQKSIADILSTYDDLIENNQKQIRLLEEAAIRQYNEWFVHFRFPDSENITIVDGLPEEWSVTKLDDIYEKLESGSRPKGGIDKNLTDGVVSIGAENVIGLGKYNFNNDKIIPKDYFTKIKRGILEDKDILIYKDGAYIGKTTLFQDEFPHKVACVNEHVFLLHAKEEYLQYYLFLTLYQPIYFEKMQKLNKNAAQPGINQDSIKSLKIILPSENIIKKFDDIVTPLFQKIFILAKQEELLKQARDLVLPKLMNGEIVV